MIELRRRSVITGLVVAIAAPAIVRATSLMPVKAIDRIARVARATEMDFAEFQRRFLEHLAKAYASLAYQGLAASDRTSFENVSRRLLYAQMETVIRQNIHALAAQQFHADVASASYIDPRRD